MVLTKPDLVRPPQRVISLVPSMTESLFDLGYGPMVVGVTDFCTVPALETARISKVGGPKNARLNDILALQPDLVMANQEENSKELVEALVSTGIPVWLTFPKTVRESLNDLWELTRIMPGKNATPRLRFLEDSLRWAELGLADLQRLRYFCPIWQETAPDGTLWWMTFNQDTYSNDLLAICGGTNVFSQRIRFYPLQANWNRSGAEDPAGRDVRYPVVTAKDGLAAMPELILLPSEPFDFANQTDGLWMDLFSETPAVKNGRIIHLDGSLITWCGTRLGRALAELPELFTTKN
jgi:ABC-type Fe3+-hydroxamate transport system substrate-binding protein